MMALILLQGWLNAQAADTSNTVFLLPEQERIALLQAIRYIEDKQGSFKLEQLLGAHSGHQWQSVRVDSDTLNFGYTDSVYWLHTRITNASQVELNRLLEIGYPVLDYLDIYLTNGSQVIAHWPLGDKYPFRQRPIQHHHFVVPLVIAPSESLHLYIRAKSSSSMQLPLVLWEQNAFLAQTQTQSIGMGIYFGIMIVMVLYNFFVFVSVREANYLYYVCYAIFMCLFVASLQGISYQYLWPDSVEWNDQIILLSLLGLFLFGAMFTEHFLRLSEEKPGLSRVFFIFVVAALMAMAGSFFIPYATLIFVLLLAIVPAIGVAIFTGMLRWLEGDSAAKFYTIAWFSLLIAGLILAFNKFSLIPSNWLVDNAVQIGSALEVVLLSFALADRLNLEKRRSYDAQQTALAHERVARQAQAAALEQEQQTRLAREAALRHEREAHKAERHALEVQRRANETLEQRVKERTHELEIANQKLEQLTFTDGLTGIGNRRYFDRRIDQEFRRAHRERQPLGLLLIDIDHFKRFNDSYGHLIGDDCLRQVAREIAACLFRDTDVTARYGGEEFAVILPNTDEPGTRHIADKIRARIEHLEFIVEGKRLQITASVGASLLTPRQELGYELLIAAADDALYQAKQKGRNQVVFNALEGQSTSLKA